MPEPLGYLWAAFLRLSRRRGSSGFGTAPITWEGIDGFLRLSGMTLAPWEIEVIEALDDLWRKQV
jgi:hypothetical protein